MNTKPADGILILRQMANPRAITTVAQRRAMAVLPGQGLRNRVATNTAAAPRCWTITNVNPTMPTSGGLPARGARRAIMMTTPHGGLTRVQPLMTSGMTIQHEGLTRARLLMTSGITQTGTMITAITMSRTATIRTTTNAITANNRITITALAANPAAAQTRAPRSTVCPA